MTVENAENQAHQITMEMTRDGLRIGAVIGKETWAEIRHGLDAMMKKVHERQQKPGGKVTTQRLEEVTRGQRDSVNLADRRVSRLVERELKRYGVTYAVTNEGGQRRVHIGAGNAAQLDQAMQRAEQIVDRRLNRADERARVMEKVRNGLKERIGQLPSKKITPDTPPVPTRDRGPKL